MMKILQINMMDMFSTGNIMLNIAKVARQRGYEAVTASKYCKMSIDLQRKDSNHLYIGNRLTNTIHRYWAWITDLQDTGSIYSTKKFIRQIEDLNPDIIHLHDVVGWYINIDLLFNYLRKKGTPVVWTFHDCWAFTGRCIYFDSVGCERWKTGCGKCPQIGYMPRTWYFDLSAWNFRRKKRLFTAINNMTIVTPSVWLKDLTEQSFLRGADIRVINNGINLTVFKPSKGEIYDDLVQDGRKIVLGVAGTWSARKGLDVFLKLADDLPDEYKIVLVGLSQDEIGRESKIKAIRRTSNQHELAQIYSAAAVFANPTFEDNFPTVNLESLACGTPVITYKTGGSPESVTDGTGMVVEQGDYQAFKAGILSIIQCDKSAYHDACLKESKKYDMMARFNDYVDLYEEILNR